MKFARTRLMLLVTVIVVAIGQTFASGRRSTIFCQKHNLVTEDNLDTQRLAGRWYVAGVSSGGWHLTSVSNLGTSLTNVTGEVLDIEVQPIVNITSGRELKEVLVVNVTHTLQGESDCIKSCWTCVLHEDRCVRPPFTWFGAVVWINIYVVATDYDSVMALYHEAVINGMAVPALSELLVAVRDPTAAVSMTAVKQPLVHFCGQLAGVDDLQSSFYVTLDNDSDLPCFAA